MKPWRTILWLMASLALAACNQEAAPERAMGTAGDAPSITELNGVVVPLQQVRSERSSATGNLSVVDVNGIVPRLRVRAAHADGIQQLFIAYSLADDAPSPEYAFALCATTCPSGPIDAWVSGLNPVDLGFYHPVAEMRATLLVDTGSGPEPVASTTFAWSPGVISQHAASWSDEGLGIQWQPIEGIQRYNVYVFEPEAVEEPGEVDPGEVVITEELRREALLAQRLAFSGTSTRFADILPTTHGERSLVYWVTGLDSRGEVAFSELSLVPYSLGPLVASVDNLITNENLPTVSGSVNYPNAALGLQVEDSNGSVLQSAIPVNNPGTGNWSIDLSTIFPSLSDDTYTLIIWAQIGNGEPVFSEGILVIDTTAPSVDLTIDPIAGDDVINLAESEADITISGTATGDVQTGDLVEISVYGAIHTTELNADGTFSIEVPFNELEMDTQVSVNLSATDAAGNESAFTQTRPYEVRTALPYAWMVTTLTNSDADLTLTGSLNVPDSELDSFTVRINEFPDEPVVSVSPEPDGEGNYTWAASFGNALSEQEGYFTVSVDLLDIYGNTASDAYIDVLQLDLTDPLIVPDDLVTEQALPVLTGTITDASEVMGVLTVIDEEGIGLMSASLTVVNGDWSLDLSAFGFDPLVEGVYTLQVDATDMAGNSSVEFGTLTIDMTEQLVANDDQYPWVWDGGSVFIASEHGLLKNDTGPVGNGWTVSTATLNEGNGGLEFNQDGSFSYNLAEYEPSMSFTYELNNGLDTATGTATIRFRDLSRGEPQICVLLPAQLAAGTTTTWDLDPLGSLGNGFDVSLVGSPGGGLGMSIAGNAATFSNPLPGLYTGISLSATNAQGDSDNLGPFAIEVVPAYSAGPLNLPADFVAQQTYTAADGSIYLVGKIVAPDAGEDLALVRLESSGAADLTFGSSGVIRLEAPLSTIGFVDATMAAANTEFNINQITSLSGHLFVAGSIYRDDGSNQWYSPFIVALETNGTLLSNWGDGGLWTEEFPDGSVSIVNWEANGLLQRSPNEIMVALNELDMNGRAAGYELYVFDPLSNLDLAYDYLISSKGTQGDRVYDDALAGTYADYTRVTRLVNGHDGGFISIKQSRPYTMNGEVQVLWHNADGTENPSYGSASTSWLQLLSNSEASVHPKAAFALTTDDGMLWQFGKVSTENSLQNLYLSGVSLTFKSGVSDPALYFDRQSDFIPATQDSVPLGLQAAPGGGVYATYFWGDGSEIVTARYLPNGALDPNFGDGGRMTVKSGVTLARAQRTVIAARPGHEFVLISSDAQDPETWSIENVALGSTAEYAPVSDGTCSFTTFRTPQGAVPVPGFGDLAVVGGDLFVSTLGTGTWRVERFENGDSWVLGPNRNSYLNLYEGDPGYPEIMAMAASPDGALVLAGYTGQEQVTLKRFGPMGQEDSSFGDSGAVYLTSPVLALDTDSASDIIIMLEAGASQTALARLNSNGQELNNTSRPMLGHGLVISGDNQRFALFENDGSSVVERLNPDLTADTSFNGGSTWSTTDKILSAHHHGSRLLLYTENGTDYSVVVHAVLNDGTMDTEFGMDGVLVLPSTWLAISYVSQNASLITTDDVGNIYLAVTDDGVTGVARLLPDGSSDLTWGNQGFVPVSHPMDDFAFLSGLVYHEGALRLVWEGYEGVALTRLDPTGHPDYGPTKAATVIVGASEGDVATALHTTESGASYVLNGTFGSPEGSVFWGLDAEGNIRPGFGSELVDDYSQTWAVPVGGWSPYNVTPVGLLANGLGQLYFSGQGHYEPKDWFVAGYDLRTLTEGLTEEMSLNQQYIVNGSLVEATLESVTPFRNGQAIFSGWSLNDTGDVDPQIFGLNQYGQSTSLLSRQQITFPDTDHSVPIRTLDLGAGRLVVMFEKMAQAAWQIGRWDANEQVATFGNAGWVQSFGDAEAVDMASDSSGNLFVLYRDLNADTVVVEGFDASGQPLLAFGGTGRWEAPLNSIYVAEALLVDPFGSIFVGGRTQQNRPILIKLNSAGEETHRWHGKMLIRSDAAQVVDLTLDPRGHLNVLMEAHYQGAWRAGLTRIPFASGTH